MTGNTTPSLSHTKIANKSFVHFWLPKLPKACRHWALVLRVLIQNKQRKSFAKSALSIFGITCTGHALT